MPTIPPRAPPFALLSLAVALWGAFAAAGSANVSLARPADSEEAAGSHLARASNLKSRDWPPAQRECPPSTHTSGSQQGKACKN